ncbi:ras GEF [Lichtheimia hyalospora FSU 10163]|nr:ras GEF [Lichtheimia hyalospora FSU 10163]
MDPLSQQHQQLRLSLAASETPSTSPPVDQRSDWILQTTEDGSEVYYYNVVTKEMRYSVPPDDPTHYEKSPSFYDHPPISNDSLRYNDYAAFSDSEEFNDRLDERPIRPARAANRLDHHQHHHNNAVENQSLLSAGTTTSSSISSPSVYTSKSGPDDQLPPNWVRKWTPKGREYYCNVLTDETTWTLDHVDPHTGVLMSPSSPPQPRLSTTDGRLSLATMGAQNSSLSSLGLGNTNFDLSPSWSHLSSQIAQAIKTLKGSVKQGQLGLFREDALMVVQEIRLLLYVANAVDKESSPHLKANKQLKNYHRALLAALAKLVLSAKVASGAWAPSEAISKLQLDADEVLIAVRNFLTIAQDMRIEVQESKPKLIHESSPNARWRSASNVSESRPDTLTTLVVLADNVHGAISSLLDSAREAFSIADDATVLSKIQNSTPLLVAQFRNLSNTTSQFLNSVEDIEIGPQHSTRFLSSKQSIHDSMGQLFISSQHITNQEISAEDVVVTFEQIESYAKTIDTGVHDICNICRQASLDRATSNNSSTTLVDNSGSIGAGRRPSHEFARPPHATGRTSRLTDIDEERMMQPQQQQQQPLPPPQQHIPGIPENFMPPQPATPPANKDVKLAKFFGEDTLEASRRRDTIVSASGLQSPSVASSSTSPGPHSHDCGDYRGSDYNPNEIVFNMEGNVKGGTVRALVQRLTQHDQLDSKFNTTFLLTYRSFCTTRELFDELFQRYTLIPPPDLTQEELVKWQEKKLKLVRLRVFNVIKSWLEKYYNEEEDRPMLPLLMQFTDTIVRESMQFGAEQLIKLVRKRMDAEDTGQIRKMTLNVRPQDMPASILPKNMKRLRFLDIDPLELARQLTVMDFKLYSRIKPVECLDKNWGKGDSEHIAANVKASIEYSNQVTSWVTDSILSKEEVKKRAGVLKHWIYVAEKCRLLNNFNTCMAILSAFDNSSIGRMKRTWELIGNRTIQTLAGIRRLMGANKNFTEYRDIIHKINPPCIPFLGIYLQDLTFIEDGNSNFLKKSKHLINFAKRMKTAEVIRELQQYQSTPYLLQAVPDIQAFIKTHLQSSRDEETLYGLSLDLEPRERDEDTIARRLKESGL